VRFRALLVRNVQFPLFIRPRYGDRLVGRRSSRQCASPRGTRREGLAQAAVPTSCDEAPLGEATPLGPVSPCWEWRVLALKWADAGSRWTSRPRDSPDVVRSQREEFRVCVTGRTCRASTRGLASPRGQEAVTGAAVFGALGGQLFT
jgi:hypothetical protein